MKQNKYLLLIMVFMIVILSFAVIAEEFSPPPGFTSSTGVSEDCRCKEFCEHGFKCFFGVCDNATLDSLNCTNQIEVGRSERAERCPVCPSCDLWSACTYGDQPNVFRSVTDDPICGEYYSYLQEDKYCVQTINYTVKDLDGFPVSVINLLLGSLVDGIDYSNVFDKANLNRDSTGNATIPRCMGNETIALIAAKQGYDADVQDVNVSNDHDYGFAFVNFTLPLGTCHVDCADSFNRCNPDCEGFTDDIDTCNYDQTIINNKNITQMCAYKPIGTDVVLAINPDNYTVVECCEGSPRVIPRPTYDIRLVSGDNLVSIQKPVRLDNGEQARLSIFYWN